VVLTMPCMFLQYKPTMPPDQTLHLLAKRPGSQGLVTGQTFGTQAWDDSSEQGPNCVGSRGATCLKDGCDRLGCDRLSDRPLAEDRAGKRHPSRASIGLWKTDEDSVSGKQTLILCSMVLQLCNWCSILYN
jgi:hypothetical protein